MRNLMSWLGVLAVAVAVHAQDFTRTMTADEQAAAGLGKLTPDELAKLRAAVERYKAGEVGAVQQRMAATEEKAKAAEQKAAAAEAKVREAEAKVATAAPAKKGPSWLSAMITLEKTAQAPDASEELRTKLKGTLETFTGRHRFELVNGQIWQTVDGNGWSGPSYVEPEVIIKPGLMGAFWLTIREAGLRLKVKPIKLE